ncbi:LapA family protein [Pseudodesulfovibrio portus]|uniref:Membrane protein n=1 Tax=Pseudodesulfovibrio portus TaxID=231439 RepID=A0ABM8AMS7_9BACT|nr:LapA family protein [Pseudodesulfovibrio portus]BDQ32687.1 membrane protein [Pseudodesulfovibrio portus]
MRFIKVLFLLFLFVFSIFFFTNNSATLTQELQLVLDIPYVATLHSIPLPFGFIVLVAFTAGCLLTIVYFAVDKFRSASKLRECRTRMASLEQELNSLRNMPIDEAQPYSEVKEEEKV